MTDDEAKTLGLRALKAGFMVGSTGALYRTGPDEYHEAWRCFAPPARNIVGDGIGPWFVNGVGDVYSIEEESAPLALIYHPWPDFRDPATLGVLLAMVREAWQAPEGRAVPEVGPFCELYGWRFAVGRLSDRQYPSGLEARETEAGALVAALEAAT